MRGQALRTRWPVYTGTARLGSVFGAVFIVLVCIVAFYSSLLVCLGRQSSLVTTDQRNKRCMIVSMDIGTIEDTFLLRPTIPTTSAIILNEKQFPSLINKINVLFYKEEDGQ